MGSSSDSQDSEGSFSSSSVELRARKKLAIKIKKSCRQKQSQSSRHGLKRRPKPAVSNSHFKAHYEAAKINFSGDFSGDKLSGKERSEIAHFLSPLKEASHDDSLTESFAARML